MVSVGIVGGGIAASCFVRAASRRARQLLCAENAMNVTVYEMGRGPSGRLATRRTRECPDAVFDHGTPAFPLFEGESNGSRPDEFSELARELIREGDLEQWKCSLAVLDANDGKIQAVDPSTQPSLYRGVPHMANLCERLLSCEHDAFRVDLRCSSLITKTWWNASAGAWDVEFTSSHSISRERHDYLLVTSALLMNGARWGKLFPGKEAPMVEAARLWKREHPDILTAVESVETQTSRPIIVTMFLLNRGVAENLPFDMVHIENHDSLRKIVVDKRKGGVVLYSTHAYAEEHSSLQSRKSSISRFSDHAQGESSVAHAMYDAFARLFRLEDAEPLRWGPLAHRWGAAFVSSSSPLQHVLGMKLLFAGDFVSGGRPLRSFVGDAGQSGCNAASALFRSLAE